LDALSVAFCSVEGAGAFAQFRRYAADRDRTAESACPDLLMQSRDAGLPRPDAGPDGSCLGRERVLSREATIGTEKGEGHESGLESADHLLAIGA
jgi:hypothetical protein